VGIAEAQGLGPGFQEAVASADDDTAVILQVERIDAVENIEGILDVSGMDDVFVDPWDLLAGMGQMWAYQGPRRSWGHFERQKGRLHREGGRGADRPPSSVRQP
jgi:2-keto-3-deoxy-L-rhamnonate aldolase RhmA